jgi:hypothetical protein
VCEVGFKHMTDIANTATKLMGEDWWGGGGGG